MKNKMSLFIFLGIFIFMIIPKNVYAASDLFITAGGVDITNGNSVYSRTGASSYTFQVSATSYTTYDFYILYVAVANTDNLNASLSGGCNSSCFGSGVTVQQTGISNGQYPTFIVILRRGKFDCGVGSGACIVDNNLTLSSDRSFYLEVYGAVGTNENPALNNNYQDFQSVIKNQNQNTNNIINNQNQNWSNFNNTDLSNSDKEAPNTDNYNDYQTAENNLFDKMQQANTNNLNVAIDSNSATWVWARITEWLNCHALLMSFLVSMLSIGIIKMALGR